MLVLGVLLLRNPRVHARLPGAKRPVRAHRLRRVLPCASSARLRTTPAGEVRAAGSIKQPPCRAAPVLTLSGWSARSDRRVVHSPSGTHWRPRNGRELTARVVNLASCAGRSSVRAAPRPTSNESFGTRRSAAANLSSAGRACSCRSSWDTSPTENRLRRFSATFHPSRRMTYARSSRSRLPQQVRTCPRHPRFHRASKWRENQSSIKNLPVRAAVRLRALGFDVDTVHD